jgi:hypothetical protein
MRYCNWCRRCSESDEDIEIVHTGVGHRLRCVDRDHCRDRANVLAGASK